MSKFSPWYRAAEEDTYLTHADGNKLNPPGWQSHHRDTPATLLVTQIWDRKRGDLDRVKVLRRCCTASVHSSSAPVTGATTARQTNALDRLFPLRNWSNICTLIHHQKKKKNQKTKKSNKMKQFNTSVKEAGAIEKLAPFIIFLFLPFRVLWWIKPSLRLMGWAGAPQFSRFGAAFSSIWESPQNPGMNLATIFLKHW